MRLFTVEFDELYARHLCRHSQAGINVIHLIALAVIWYAVYSLLYCFAPWEWLIVIPALLYLAVLLPNLPLRVFGVTACFLGLILGMVLFLPLAPFWVYIVLILDFYKVQSWSHRFYTLEFDMTEFNKKYRKGPLLFVVLLLYEVPIVFNYLLSARTLEAERSRLQRSEVTPTPAP
jgi:hypothetical protein